VREGSKRGCTGCLQTLGNEAGLLCTHVHTRAQPSRVIRAWHIEQKKEGSVGETDAENDGGAWGEIRNEREEKPTEARR